MKKLADISEVSSVMGFSATERQEEVLNALLKNRPDADPGYLKLQVAITTAVRDFCFNDQNGDRQVIVNKVAIALANGMASACANLGVTRRSTRDVADFVRKKTLKSYDSQTLSMRPAHGKPS